MKKGLLVLVAMLLVVSAGMAQPFHWTYDSTFYEGTLPHGVVVDPEGKVWIGQYYYTDVLDNGVEVSAIRVFNPDGTEASFSPIMTFTIDGVADTLKEKNRGLALDQNGNILASSGYLYRFNYQTGEAMNKYDYLGKGATALTKAAVDQNGFIYLTKVVPSGDPIVILDQDFQLYSFAVDTNNYLSRALEVSPDGKDLFLPDLLGSGVLHYHSDDGPDGTYELVKVITPDTSQSFKANCADWDPAGNLWVGTHFSSDIRAWYAFNTTSGAVVDSIGKVVEQVYSIPSPSDTIYSPRGIAFWEDTQNSRWVAYVADFDGAAVKKFVNSDPWTGIIKVDNEIYIKDFNLAQNFPNPFNPTTTIPFTINKAAHVQLNVYNVNGQLVKTLIDERLEPGYYEYQFDGSELATGIYFYRLIFDGKIQTRRMTLLK